MCLSITSHRFIGIEHIEQIEVIEEIEYIEGYAITAHAFRACPKNQAQRLDQE